MSDKHLHIIVGAVLAFFLLALGGFVPFWMPMMGEMIALLIVILLMIVWVAFIMQEKTTDEREVALKLRSTRIAYLSGLGILTAALIAQTLSHTMDPWIPVAVAVMVVVKLFTRLYIE